MGCTHTSRLDVSARVSFNALRYYQKNTFRLLCQSHDCVSEREPLQHNHSRWETDRYLMLFTAPSVWETLLACKLACLLNCFWCVGLKKVQWEVLLLSLWVEPHGLTTYLAPHPTHLMNKSRFSFYGPSFLHIRTLLNFIYLLNVLLWKELTNYKNEYKH